jgi:hypothetical protein
MDEKRTQFTFYESFYRALQHINAPSERAIAYDLLCEYALYGNEPELEGLPEAVAMFFELCKPNLNAARRKSTGGRAKGGTKKDEAPTEDDTEPKASVTEENAESAPSSSEDSRKTPGSSAKDSRKIVESSPQDTGKIPASSTEDTENKKKKEKEVENKNKKEVKNKCYLPPSSPPDRELVELKDCSTDLQEAVHRWLTYKAERRERYQPTGLKALITQIRSSASKYGDEAVIEVINTSMSSGYQGIVFDRLKRIDQPKPWSAAAYKATTEPPTPVDVDKLRGLMDKM